MLIPHRAHPWTSPSSILTSVHIKRQKDCLLPSPQETTFSYSSRPSCGSKWRQIDLDNIDCNVTLIREWIGDGISLTRMWTPSVRMVRLCLYFRRTSSNCNHSILENSSTPGRLHWKRSECWWRPILQFSQRQEETYFFLKCSRKLLKSSTFITVSFWSGTKGDASSVPTSFSSPIHRFVWETFWLIGFNRRHRQG